MDLTQAITERFTIKGDVLPLVALRKAVAGEWRPRRAMGGWLMTYGKVGPDGGIVPTVDRDGHTVEAAKELGHIDWSSYMKGGAWNDTHDEGVVVGLPTSLEFHDGTTALSKAHGKVGFWTTGYLLDREDPKTYEGLGRTPTPNEFARADHFWSLSHLLKGMPRPLGLSAHGLMALSPCRTRIIYAKVDQAAVCELPINPDATLESLAKSLDDSPLSVLRKGMVGRAACGRCTCPPGACEGLLRKAVHTGEIGTRAVVPESLEGGVSDTDTSGSGQDRHERLVEMIMARYMIDRPKAERWIADFLRRTLSKEPSNGRNAA